MLVFPSERRVPPPDLAGTGRPTTTPAAVGLRAIVHAAASTPTAPRYPRVGLEPAAPGEPRTLAFPSDLRTPLPGTPRERKPVVANVRAIVHADPPVRPAMPRTPAAPHEPRDARHLAFDASLVRRFS